MLLVSETLTDIIWFVLHLPDSTITFLKSEATLQYELGRVKKPSNPDCSCFSDLPLI